MLDSGDLRLQIDQFSVSSLNQKTTSLADITTGTKTTKDGFADFSKSVVRALEEMLIKMLIVLPIARANI